MQGVKESLLIHRLERGGDRLPEEVASVEAKTVVTGATSAIDPVTDGIEVEYTQKLIQVSAHPIYYHLRPILATISADDRIPTAGT